MALYVWTRGTAWSVVICDGYDTKFGTCLAREYTKEFNIAHGQNIEALRPDEYIVAQYMINKRDRQCTTLSVLIIICRVV